MIIRLIKMLKYKVTNIVNDAQSMTTYPFVWFTFCFTDIYQPKAKKIQKSSVIWYIVQQFVNRHVAPRGNIILIPIQQVIMLCAQRRMKKKQIQLILDLTRPEIIPTIYCTRGEHVNQYLIQIQTHIHYYQSRRPLQRAVQLKCNFTYTTD